MLIYKHSDEYCSRSAFNEKDTAHPELSHPHNVITLETQGVAQRDTHSQVLSDKQGVLHDKDSSGYKSDDICPVHNFLPDPKNYVIGNHIDVVYPEKYCLNQH